MNVCVCDVQWLSDDVASCATNMTRTQQLMHSKIQQQHDDSDDSATESTYTTFSALKRAVTSKTDR